MLFSGITFLFYFLPTVLIVYFLLPAKYRNVFLMLASFFFYGWGEPIYVLFMLLSIAVHYAAARLIARAQSHAISRLWLIVAVIFSLGLLGYFKYADFFVANVNAVTGLSIPLLHVALPIGISFYTFQLLSYTVDVYRGSVPVQRNPIKLATYVSMFPQLIAGPIVRYADVAAALDRREHSPSKVRGGLTRFIIGLAKKVIIANSLGEIGKAFTETGGGTVLWHWLYAIAFTLQIYYDFSGYSDMAIGLGRILGFDFPENFNYPFISRSITEFWRRWHISLSSWFRDYVYIPLGGNRVSAPRRIFNIAVVWLLTGLWHGAGWTFILWGAGFAVLLILEKLGLLKRLDQAPAVLRHCYMLFIVVISFVLFDAPDLQVAGARIGAMFGGGALPLADTLSLYYLRSYGLLLILAAVGSTPVVKRIFARLKDAAHSDKILTAAEPVMNIALLLIVSGYLLDASFNPFLYFRF